MSVHKPATKVQALFLKDIEAARKAGVNIGSTSEILYQSVLMGLSTIQFPGTSWGAVALTDEYLYDINDNLRDRAHEQGKYDSVKWSNWH